MRNVAVIALTALGGIGSLPAFSQNVNSPVEVYVHTDSGDPRLALIRHSAQTVAAGMLAKAGVQVIWRSGTAHAKGEPPMTIDIKSDVPEAFHRGSLAYAELFGVAHITILYNRLEYRDGPHATMMLLAHVLAHEIVHVLQALDRHSERGIMKAHWRLDDFVQMSYRPLQFDAEDLALLRDGLSRRTLAKRPQP